MLSVNGWNDKSWKSWILFLHPQLPVPIVVLCLMYREQLIPCCPRGSPGILHKDELAMENQQGTGSSDMEQKEHEAGGKVVAVKQILTLKYFHWISLNVHEEKKLNAILHATVCDLWSFALLQVMVISLAVVRMIICAVCQYPSLQFMSSVEWCYLWRTA